MCVLIRNAGALAMAADNRSVYMQNGKVARVVSNDIKKLLNGMVDIFLVAEVLIY